MSAETFRDLPVLAFETQAAWESWLADHHAEPQGLWIRFYKKAAKQPTVTYAEALDVALCYGWIDGQAQKYDADSYLQRFTPRRKRSLWSKVNRGKAEALIAAGRMQPAGLREIEAARADGRWEAAYDAFSKAEAPEDFAAELSRHPQAQAFFESLSQTNRYSFLYRIQTAKKPETRRKHIDKAIEMLQRGETYH